MLLNRMKRKSAFVRRVRLRESSLNSSISVKMRLPLRRKLLPSRLAIKLRLRTGLQEKTRVREDAEMVETVKMRKIFPGTRAEHAEKKDKRMSKKSPSSTLPMMSTVLASGEGPRSSRSRLLTRPSFLHLLSPSSSTPMRLPITSQWPILMRRLMP